MNATKAKADDATDKPAGDGDLTEDLAAVRKALARLAERLGGEEGAALDRARLMADDLTNEWRRIEGDIAEGARRNPWRALATAGIFGFVLGLLIRR